jgi:hypothetical protein
MNSVTKTKKNINKPLNINNCSNEIFFKLNTLIITYKLFKLILNFKYCGLCYIEKNCDTIQIDLVSTWLLFQ